MGAKPMVREVERAARGAWADLDLAATPAPDAAARWIETRAEVARLLVTELGGGRAVRLGEVDGRVVEVDRIDGSSGDVSFPHSGACRIRVTGEATLIDLILPGRRDLSPQTRRRLVELEQVLRALTPASPAHVILEEERVAFRCASARAWLAWPGWEVLFRKASRASSAIHQGARVDSVALDGGRTSGRLMTVSRVSPPRPPSEVTSATLSSSRSHECNAAVLFPRSNEPPPPPRRRTIPAGWTLTKRQTAVAELVLRGLSNKEIASELGCSEVTVEKHLTEVFRRTGVTSRTRFAATVWQSER